MQEEQKEEIVLGRGQTTEQSVSESPLAFSPKPLLLRVKKQRPPKAVRENAQGKKLWDFFKGSLP